MSINPEQKPYLKLTPLRMQCLTNFPFIEADFDALTDYQLFCEIVKYLNNVIKNENVVTDNVIALYNAFMELQSEVESELAEQNQRIDDYFENTNIQAFVDNKINQMIATNEFQTLLEEAILDINPDALKDVKRINVLDFGSDLQTSGVYDSFRDDVFLDDSGSDSNKNKVISILNEMLSSNVNKYYFINKSDDDNIYRLYCIKLDTTNHYNVIIYYDLHYINVNNPVVRYSTLFEYTLNDNVVTDTSYNNSYASRTYYTGSGVAPAGDGDPYFVSFISENSGTYIDFTSNNGGWYFADSTDIADFGEVLTDLNSKGINTCIMWFGNNAYPPIKCKLIKIRFEFDNVNNLCTITANPYFEGSDNILSYQFTPDFVDYINLGFNIVDGVFTDLNFNYVYVNHNTSTYLPVDNASQYEPQTDYEPATKKYVDDNDIEALDLVIPGFLTNYYATYVSQGSNIKHEVIALRYKNKTQAFYSIGTFTMQTNAQYTGQIILGYVSNDGIFGITDVNPTSIGIGDVAFGIVNLNNTYKMYPIVFVWDSSEQKYAMTIDFGNDTIPTDTYVLIKINISRSPLNLN